LACWRRFGPIEPATSNFGVAMLLAAGFFVGASVGAIVATRLHADILRRLFGVFLLLVSLHMTFGRHGK
jgi:uncharacterized membrane protein YfcA